jgi:hypothetical protein
VVYSIVILKNYIFYLITIIKNVNTTALIDHDIVEIQDKRFIPQDIIEKLVKKKIERFIVAPCQQKYSTTTREWIRKRHRVKELFQLGFILYSL